MFWCLGQVLLTQLEHTQSSVHDPMYLCEPGNCAHSHGKVNGDCIQKGGAQAPWAPQDPPLLYSSIHLHTC